MRSRQLILGAASGYGPAQLGPFIHSLCGHGYQGDVALFTFNLDADTQRFFAEQGIQALPLFPPIFTGRYHWIASRILAPAMQRLAKPHLQEHFWRFSELWMHFMNARFVGYLRYLENTITLYDEIIITDVRDVIFQGNPFNFNYGCDIAYFAEADTQTIGSCSHNSQWIEKLCGPEVLQQLKDKVVVCAGVIYLKASGALPYLRAMVAKLSAAQSKMALDQGAHNFFAYQGNLPGGKIFPQHSSPVLNIGLNRPETLQRDSAGYMLNPAGQRALVVHQYDRHLSLRDALPQVLCPR